MEINSTVMLTFLTIINQVKIYHWQTLSHSRHRATDQLYSELGELVDKFIEVLTGRLIIETDNQNYRILLTNNLNQVKLNNYIDDKGYKLINNIRSYLESDELNLVIGKNTELANIRDEMLASVNRVSYLFSLN
jgi:hypothetical protein